MQVLDARATSRSRKSKMSHSTRPTVWPDRTILASAQSFPVQTGRRKLIFNSIVVNVSPYQRQTQKFADWSRKLFSRRLLALF
jgi:hypothetical protein